HPVSAHERATVVSFDAKAWAARAESDRLAHERNGAAAKPERSAPPRLAQSEDAPTPAATAEQHSWRCPLRIAATARELIEVAGGRMASSQMRQSSLDSFALRARPPAH